MPRNENNNPTFRIGRLLDDFDELSAAYDETIALVSNMLSPELFSQLPAKPSATNVAEEKVRRQLMLSKTNYSRLRMRLVRSKETYDENA